MGIFDRVRNRMMGRSESFEDIRSYVVGAAQQAGPVPQPALATRKPSMEFGRDEGDIGPPMKSYEAADVGFDEPTEPSFVTRKPISLEESKPSSNYDILDRLSLIEAQLSAIRSQTETINERLKNMEVRLTGRRMY